MEHLLEKLKDELKNRNIQLSYHRLKVLEYLVYNQIHPTVDKIFTDLQKEIPTLSKTTIYNTLKILVDEGLVRTITIEDNEIRYDIIVETHGHFKCESCGDIFNFKVDIDNCEFENLTDFQIHDKSVYFKGICPKCL